MAKSLHPERETQNRIVKFFETNEEPFQKQETLAVLAIRDAIIKGVSGEFGQRVAVESY